MQCPICNDTFLFVNAKNKSWSLKGALNCPYCDARLQNPEHLQKAGLYLKFLIAFIFYMVVFFYLVLNFDVGGLVVALPFALALVYWMLKAMKMKNGFIQLVTLND